MRTSDIVDTDNPSEFNIGYLILAHNNFLHLRRLCTALLADPNSRVFVHVDAKSKLDGLSLPDEVNLFSNRYKVFWGDFTTIEATYYCLQEILNSGDSIKYFVLLSGADFPIKHAAEINSYFFQNRNKIFMDADKLPSARFDKPIDIITWNCDRPNIPRYLSRVRQTLKNIGIIKHHRDYKAVLKNHIPYSGSQWWAMPRHCVEFLFRWRDEHKKIYRYFKNVTIPDDSLFQTALLNSEYKSDVHSYVTFCDWSDGPPHPLELNENHIDLFLESEMKSNNNPNQPASIYMFARKFNDSSNTILKKLPSYVNVDEKS